MIFEQMLMGSTSEGGYSPNAVKLDGANDYLTRGADLTGIADGTAGLFSAWIRLDGADAILQTLLANLLSTSRFNVTRTAANKFRFFARTSVPATILDQATTATYQASEKWIHLLASWDLTATTAYIYINDVADVTSTTKTNGTIDYVTATPNWSVGSETDGTSKFYGSLADVYFTNTFLDISNSTNRRKFISATGYPVSLGSDGSTPTGTAPIIYLKGDASAFGVNSGTGGNFTVNGTLEKASTTPATMPVFNAVDFDGSADYLSKATDLAGVADGKTFILSAWIRIDGALAKEIFASTGYKTELYVNTSGDIWIGAKSAASAAVITWRSATGVVAASPAYRHILASFDLANGGRTVYLDGVALTPATNTYSNADIDFTAGGWTIGDVPSPPDATYRFSGAISELYFAPNQYLDLSVQANREKFILNGAPVSLGSDGSLPTGTAPAIYLPNRAALVGTNAGTGGNFTINGAPKDANSTPVYYYAEPATFDGTNDYMLRGGNLTGIVAGKAGTISFWYRKGASGAAEFVLANIGGGVAKLFVQFDASNKFQVTGRNAANATILSLTSTTAYTASAVWVHCLVAWDLAATTGMMYVNNANDQSGGTKTDGTIDYAPATTPDYTVGAAAGGAAKLNGAIADLWFNTTYLDISQASNRAKFIDQTTLRPVALGAKGELPTGSQPLLYLGRDYSNFQTNLGSGGAFTVTGALTRGTTSPSDVRA